MTASVLSEHRITHIYENYVHTHYPRNVGRNARRGVHGTGCRTRVRALVTDQGAVGWGVCHDEELDTALCVGKRVSELFDLELGVLDPAVLSLDFALHDLAGVILGKPVYELLGARGDRVVPCYDGAIYMDDLLPEDHPRGTEAILLNCTHDYERGYRAFKLKIGRGHRWMDPDKGIARDISVTREVRKHFPDCDILVDANDGFACDQFLRYLDGVAECGLYWIEEPFPENRVDLLRLCEYLAKHSPETLVADGESGYDVEVLISLASEGLVDVLIMDIVGLGFTGWRHLMPRLVEAHVRASPHTWGDPLKTLYVCQLASGTGNVNTVEGVPATSRDADWSAYRLSQGAMHVPSVSGFGIKLLVDR